jgi:hypothetical protein
VKSSKKRLVYTLKVDDKLNIIEIFNSVVSGKKKLVLNGKVMFEGK